MRPAPNSTSVVFSRSSNRQPPPLPGLHWIGWVKSAHGLKGEIYIQLNSKQADWLDSVESLTLWNVGKTQVLEIERATPFKDGLRVKLKGIEDRNQSEALRKSQVFIEESVLVAEPGENLFLNQILNFDLVNPTLEKLGQIVGFGTNGVQDLLRIRPAGIDSSDVAEERLVPFVDQFIVRIDLENRQVIMDLPEGLLDLE